MLPARTLLSTTELFFEDSDEFYYFRALKKKKPILGHSLRFYALYHICVLRSDMTAMRNGTLCHSIVELFVSETHSLFYSMIYCEQHMTACITQGNTSVTLLPQVRRHKEQTGIQQDTITGQNNTDNKFFTSLKYSESYLSFAEDDAVNRICLKPRTDTAKTCLKPERGTCAIDVHKR